MMTLARFETSERHWGTDRTRRLLAAGFVAGLLLLGSIAAEADRSLRDAKGDDPRKIVETTVARLLAAVDDEPSNAEAAVSKVLSQFVDFERISRFVVGRHWKTITLAQKARFTAQFRTLIARGFAGALANVHAEDLHYAPTRFGGDHRKATVTAEMSPADSARSPVAITYRMVRREERWRLLDIVIDGVSLVKTYRASFRAKLMESGIDGLIATLRRKNRLPKGAG